MATVAHRTAAGISCVVCAYNEADRIGAILDAIVGHPALAEIIVVNDGSTDDTLARLAAWPSVRVISYAENRGKTWAMGQGVSAARGDWILLLDADLAGLRARDIDALAAPVLDGRADMSISLRRNSLWFYRLMGLDFVSGERLLPAEVMVEAAKAMARLPRWGAEAWLNEQVLARRLRLAVVDWPGVSNIRKHEKVGALQGALEELRMTADALRVLSPLGVARQYLALLGQVTQPARPPMRRALSRVAELRRAA
ncbi:glycosyltransferase family 2 protein [Caulobacter sp. KR2-114]|uniref:glycosyltransferase family 2 protein n=1 Tax=Caulobacter sp. KR2-114 TaxID=3400912 RepID=UPI003C025E17